MKTENRAKEICTTLAAAGYVAVSVDHRLGAGAWPNNLPDCKNAVHFRRANAAKYQLDPDRIAGAGGSTGGHLALMVGFTGDQPEFEPTGVATPYPGISSKVRAVIAPWLSRFWKSLSACKICPPQGYTFSDSAP